MNAFDPFAPPRLDPQTIKENVQLWRKNHGLTKADKFKNEPRILKLSGKKIIINAIDQVMGKEGV